MAQIKGKKFNCKHKHRQMGKEYVKRKRGDFSSNEPRPKIPPGFPSFVGQGRPSCHSPKTIKKSLFMPLLDSRRHKMSLTSKYQVFR